MVFCVMYVTLVIFFVTGCWFGSSSDYDTVKGSVKVFSVKEGTPITNLVLKQERMEGGGPLGSTLGSFQPGLQPKETGVVYGTNNAGPADSLTLTLKGISFIMQGGDEVKGLDEQQSGGQRTITLSGTSEGTTISDIPIPVGTIAKVKLFFDPFAKIKGIIPEKTYTFPDNTTQSLSVRTRSPYYYDAFKNKMMDTKGTLVARGDDEEVTSPLDYTYYQVSPVAHEAEEALVCLSNQEYFVVETPLNKPIQDNTTPTINIAADLSRMLRFSVNGSELEENSTGVMFTSNHLVNYLFAAFVGSGGTIQGYEYSYDTSNNFDAAWAQRGWLILVYDSQGAFAYGALVPDSLGRGSPEGYITEYPQNNSSPGASVTFKVKQDEDTQFNIENYQKLSNLDESVVATLTDSTDTALTNGGIRFTLKYNVAY